MENKVIFYNGEIIDKQLVDLPKIIEELKSRLDFIYNLSVDDLLEFFDKLAIYWRGNKELTKKIGNSLKPLAEFIKKENMIELLNFSLRGNYKILDTFVDFKKPNYIYTCQPRGLAVHWLAGNVPMLGIYSVIQSIITKNVSLIKAPSQGYEDFLILLDSFKQIETMHIKGKELVKSICVILIDKNNTQLQNTMSEMADIRIAWGGKEAIEAIMGLRRKIFSEDIIFGPKYSYGVIDKEALKDYKKIAQRLAFDICTFDQYACSSPHTIFVQENEQVSALEFAKELSKNMDFVSKKMIKKGRTETEKKMDILTIRTKYSMLGKVFKSEDYDWTVVYTTEEGLAEPCFSRVIFVKPIDDLLKLAEFNNQKIQTLGCAIYKDKEEIIRKITRKGVDRCPRFGDMTLYESPWDGFFPIDRMVRWVKCYK